MENNKCKCMRLSPIAMGIAMGVLSGVVMLVFAWAAYWYGYAMPVIHQWAAIYPGFDATLRGGLVGLAWGFLDGFIIGFVLVYLYNLCLCCCAKHCCCCPGNSSCKTKK